MGEHKRLRDKRMSMQYSKVHEFCEPVERITGRKVRAFLSSTDTEVDGLSVETFVLHPEGYDGPSRIDARSTERRERHRGAAALRTRANVGRGPRTRGRVCQQGCARATLVAG